METEITVRIVADDNGYFIAKAVGYPGVITFGKSQEEAVSGIQEAWNAMAQFNAIKNIGNPKQPIYSRSASNDVNLKLQFA
jgi:predicted RNase H-like HicB family nuclease